MDELKNPSANPKVTTIMCVKEDDNCMNAFNWYLSHFHKAGQDIALIHVYTEPNSAGYVPMNAASPELIHEYERQMRRAKEDSIKVTLKYQKILRDKGITSYMYNVPNMRTVGYTVKQLASEVDAKCIVLGGNHDGAIKRTLIGSTADYLLKNTHAAVISVPDPHQRK